MLSDWGLSARHEHGAVIIAYRRDGKDLSSLMVFDRWMHLGRALVHVAGIGGVETKPAAREMGLARRVMLGTVEWMADRFDMAMLYGIEGFYSKFGFAPCVPEYRHEIRVADADRAVAALAVRPYVPEDKPALLALHAQRVQAWVGSMERDPESFNPLARGSDFGRHAKIAVALDGDGSVVGYLMYDDLPDRLVVGEIGGEGNDLFESLTAFAVSAARGRGTNKLLLSLPPDDPYVLWARRLGLDSKIHYPRDHGCMMRITNLASTCRHLVPEWQPLLPDDVPGLCLQTDIGAVSLIRDGGSLRVEEASSADLPILSVRQDLLSALIMGYRSVQEAISAEEGAANPQARAIASALFPPRWGYTAGPDRF